MDVQFQANLILSHDAKRDEKIGSRSSAWRVDLLGRGWRRD